jgi:signal transduction histidine kinase
LNAETLDEHRLRRLIDAGRLVVSELELDAVLERLLEAARDVTSARYAALGVLDQGGRGLDRFTSLGLDGETRRRIGPLPRGKGVLGVLITDPRPLRLTEVGEHPRSYGFPEGHPPMHTFLGVPVRVRGKVYGNLYLTEKKDGAFTQADEEAVILLGQWAGIAIANARSVAEERLRESIEGSERERGRWSRELHDDTLQGLGALRVLLAAALRRGGPEVTAAAEQAVEQLTEEISKLRGLISELRPAALDIGLEAALEALAERSSSRDDLEVRMSIALNAGGDEPPRLGGELERAIYRLAQEALTNAGRHSQAEGVEVRLSRRDRLIELVVEDDGIGFDPGSSTTGFGLRGIRERVALAGGRLKVESEPGTGTRLTATFPTDRRSGA